MARARGLEPPALPRRPHPLGCGENPSLCLRLRETPRPKSRLVPGGWTTSSWLAASPKVGVGTALVAVPAGLVPSTCKTSFICLVASLCLLCCTRAFLEVRLRGLLSLVVAGFSVIRRLVGSLGSGALELQQLWCMVSVVPRRVEPSTSLALAGGFLTFSHQGSLKRTVFLFF